MEEKDNILKVYNKLSTLGYPGTEDDFREYIQDPNNVSKVWKKFSESGYPGTEDDFREYIAAPRVDVSDVEQAEQTNTPVAQQATAPAGDAANGTDGTNIPTVTMEQVENADTMPSKPSRTASLLEKWGYKRKLKRWEREEEMKGNMVKYNFSPDYNAENYKAVRQRAAELEYRMSQIDGDSDEAKAIGEEKAVLDQYIKGYKATPEYKEARKAEMDADIAIFDEIDQKKKSTWLDAFGKTVGAMLMSGASEELHGQNPEAAQMLNQQSQQQLSEASKDMIIVQTLNDAKSTLRQERADLESDSAPNKVAHGIHFANLTNIDAISSLSGAIGLYEFSQHFDKDGNIIKPLDERDQMLYDALVYNSYVQGKYGEDISMLNRVGNSIPQTVGFVLDFVIGSKLGAGAIGKGAAKLTSKGINNVVKKEIKRDAMKFVLDKALPTVAEMGANATYRTVLDAPFVTADALERHTGQWKYDPKTGNYKFADGVGWGEAIGKATASRFNDNVTELVGDKFFEPGFAWLGRNTWAGQKIKAFRKAIGEFGNGRVDEMLKGVRDFSEKTGTGWQSWGVETLEELTANFNDALFIHDRTWKENFSSETMLETALNCMVFGIGQTTAVTAANRGAQVILPTGGLPSDIALRNGKRKAASVIDGMENISTAELDAHIETDKGNALADWLYQKNAEGLWSDEQRSAVMSYVQNTVAQKARHQMRDTGLRADIEKAEAEVDEMTNNVSGNVIDANFEVDGQKFTGSVIGGRVSFLENEVLDGNGNPTMAYQYNPHLSSATLSVMVKNPDGTVTKKMIPARNLTSINSVSDPETVKQQRREGITALAELQTTLAMRTPSINDLWNYDFKNPPEDANRVFSIRGQNYFFNGFDEYGNYTFLYLDEKGEPTEQVMKLTERNFVKMTYLDKLDYAIRSGASNEEIDDIIDDLNTEQTLENMERSKDEANVWQELSEFLGKYVTLTDDGDFDPDKSDADGAAGYLVSLKQGDINKAAAIVDERIAELKTRLVEKPEGVQNNGEGVVGMAVNDNAATASAEQAAKAIAFLETVRGNIMEMQQMKQEENQLKPITEMQRDDRFPVVFSEKIGEPVVLATAIVQEQNTDGNGNVLVEIVDENDEPLQGGAGFIASPEDLQAMRETALEKMAQAAVVENGTNGTDGTDTTVSPESSISSNGETGENSGNEGNISPVSEQQPEQTVTPQPETAPEQPAMPMRKVKKQVKENGKKKTVEVEEEDYLAVPAEQTHQYLYEQLASQGLTEQDANDIVNNNLNEANKTLDEAKKTPSATGSAAARIAEKQQIEDAIKAAQGVVDYWNAVKAMHDKVVAERLAAQQAADEERHAQAVAEEEARRAEEERKAREREATGANNVAPNIREKWEGASKVEGNADEITLANGECIAGHYVLVESGAASASHDALNGFAKTKGFPLDENEQSVNDRDYERDQNAQQITRQIAAEYDSRALQQPVVVSQDGVVLSGNGRTMAGEIAAAQNTDGAYIDYLKKYAPKYGFTPEQVEGMAHPRVVFVPDASMPYTAETFAKFNQQEMKGQSKTEQAVKLGKLVDDATFGRIIRSINRFDTLGDFYADTNATADAIGDLLKAGAINQMQRTEMFDGDAISAQGREILENMLIGKAFESNPDAVRQLTAYKSLRQSVITALAEISNNIALGEEYSLERELSQAIALAYQARQNGYKAGDRVSEFARTGVLFQGEALTVAQEGATAADYTNAIVLMLADLLNDNRVTRLKRALTVYNKNASESAAGQIDLFAEGVKTKQDILNEVLLLLQHGTESEQQQALDAAVEQRKSAAEREESVQQDGVAGEGDQGERGGVEPQPITAAVAAANEEVDTNPTEAQKEAGNYKKGHVKIDGFDISIENPAGSTRSGTDAQGNPWSVTMHNSYGYIRMTEGVDGDHIDIFLSDHIDDWNGTVYVVDQVNEDGSFDEHKVMYGFNSAEEARESYLSNYSEGWQGLGTITGVSREEFKKWVDSSHRKTKAFADYKSVQATEGQNEAAMESRTEGTEQAGEEDRTDRTDKQPTKPESREELDRRLAEELRQRILAEGTEYDQPFGLVPVSETMTAEDIETNVGRIVQGLKDNEGSGNLNEFYGYAYQGAFRKNAGQQVRVYLLSLGRVVPKETLKAWYDSHGLKTIDDLVSFGERLYDETQTPETKPETQPEPKKPKTSSKVGSQKIEDVGEKIAGARKDMRREIAKGIGDATVQSLIELPFSKAFKKPNLKKAVESGALREEDAFFFDAWMAAMVNQTKPKVTQQDTRRKKYNPNYETDLERWAKQTFEALDFLKTFVEADETERDRIISEQVAEPFPDREAQLAEFDRIRELNKGRERDIQFGDLLTPNPLWVTYRVMQRLGYTVGDKLDIPFGILKGNTTGTSYSLYNLKDEHSGYIYPTSLEEGIDAIVWLAKIKRGDSDIQHPVSAFYTTPTKSEMGDSGRFRVIWGGWSSMKNQEFDTKEEAEAFAAKKKDASVHPIQVVTRRFGYKIMFRNPLNGERSAVSDMEFDTKEEAEAYMDGNYDTMNDGANEMLAKERGTKREVTADDVVSLTVTYGKDGWQHAVVINAAYANNMGMPLVLQEFKDRGEAKAFLEEVKGKVFETYKQYKAKQKEFVYFSNGEDTRIGEDYRGGRDVTAEDFMNTFGFRGVQFGNWTNQADRQMAVNQAYDAFMDLAKLIGMSPRAMSLNGELGIAFGARGSGNANAHYELDEVVINLTKTRGAGSLAHEWWHALDNYFARRGGMSRGMVTDVKSIAMRDALRQAYNRLIDEVQDSNYYKRSVSKGDYWGRMHEVTARLLAEWVNRELKKKGELNTFLARGVNTDKFVEANYEFYKWQMENAGQEAMPFDEFKELDKALSGLPYPSDKEIDGFSDALRGIFDTIEEREGENGATELFSISPEDWNERVIAGQDLKDEANSYGHHPSFNHDYTVNLVHGTSEENAEKIRKEGLQKGSYLAQSEEESRQHVSAKRKNNVFVVMKVDARDISYNGATNEYYAQDGLVMDEDGVWVSPQRKARNDRYKTEPQQLAYNAIREALEKAGIEVVEATEEDVKRLKESRPQLKDSKGTIRGWVGEGKIFLTKDGLTAETPIHEYTHLWAEMMQMQNPELWEQIKGLLKKTPVWDEVKRMKAYSNLKDDDAVAGEVLSRISGRENGKRMEAEAKRMIDEAPTLEEAAKAANLLGRMREALKRFWTWVGKTLLGRKGNITIEQVQNMILADLVNGVNPFGPRGGKRTNRTNGTYNASVESEMGTIKREAQANGTFMKAPNGKPTKLTERQWLQVRTEAFKKWFGDWELAAKLKAILNLKAIPEKQLQKGETYESVYKSIGDVKNNSDGITARFFNSTYKKIAIEGMPSEKVVPMLKDCFEQSVFAYSEPDNKAGQVRTNGTVHKAHPNISEYRNYVGKVIIGGQEYYVRFIVQVQPGQTGLHAYDVTNIDIYKNTAGSLSVANNHGSRVTTSGKPDAKLQQFFESATEAEKNSSKIVDENGEPRVVYHSYDNENYDSGLVYMSANESFSQEFGENTDAVFVNIRNPYTTEDGILRDADGNEIMFDGEPASIGYLDSVSDDYISWLQGNYDGVMDGDFEFVIAFEPTQIKSATENNGEFDPNNPDIRFSIDAPEGGREAVRDKFDEISGAHPTEKAKTLHQKWEQLMTDQVNKFRPLKQLEELLGKVAEKKGRKLRDTESFYSRATMMTARSLPQMEAEKSVYTLPLEQAVNSVFDILDPNGERWSRLSKQVKKASARKMEELRQRLADYLIAKHGLERNEWFHHQALKDYEERMQKYDEWLKKDAKREYDEFGEKYGHMGAQGYEITWEAYIESRKPKKPLTIEDKSGLTGLAKSLKEDPKNYKAVAERVVAEFEQQVGQKGVDDLWNAINTFTNRILELSYNNGFSDKDHFEELKGRWKHYVPLRGFAEGTSDDLYYYTTKGSDSANPNLKAKGRTSKAEDPLVHLIRMQESAVMTGNENWAKQALYNAAINLPNDLLRVKQVWYTEDPATGEIVEHYADTSQLTNPDDIDAAVKQFDADMKAAGAKRRLNKADVGKRIRPQNLSEHEVEVYVNGKKVIIEVNGNPSLVRAYGESQRELSGFVKGVAKANRVEARLFTSWNPEFAVKNMMRDTRFALFSAFVTSGWREHKMGKMRVNIDVSRRVLPHLMKDGKVGALVKDASRRADLEKWYREFIDNGGETGFTRTMSAEQISEDISDTLRALAKGSEDGTTKLQKLMGSVETLNRWAENSTRFAAYITARESGKSVRVSMDEAKNSTLNFNIKGYEGKAFRAWFAFFNARLQSVAQLARLAKQNPKRFAIGLGAAVLTGAMIPWLNILLLGLGGDDDDWKTYEYLSEYTGNNNLIVFVPGIHKWVTIPYSQELAPFSAQGNVWFREMMGWNRNKSAWQQELEMGLAYLPMEIYLSDKKNTTGFWASTVFRSVTPTILQPAVEYMFNENFMNVPLRKDNQWNTDMAAWTKAYENRTSGSLISLSKWLNGGSATNKWGKAEFLIDPTFVQHVIEGTAGGVGSFIGNGRDLFTEPDWFNHLPFVRKFMFDSDPKKYQGSIDRAFGKYAYDFIDEQDQRVKAIMTEKNETKDFVKEYLAEHDSTNTAIYNTVKDYKENLFKAYGKKNGHKVVVSTYGDNPYRKKDNGVDDKPITGITGLNQYYNDLRSNDADQELIDEVRGQITEYELQMLEEIDAVYYKEHVQGKKPVMESLQRLVEEVRSGAIGEEEE